MSEQAENILYYGDNLDVLQRYIKDETVDLVYLDPPFKSNQDYNILFAEQNGSRAAAQIKAFEDTWQWDQAAAESYQDIVESGGEISQTMQALHSFLGTNDMMAYLSMMAPRLIGLRRSLKPTGSIYLHCDPTASHYLKILMDAIFGPLNFRNEIAWCYRRYTALANRFQRLHDIILFYSKTENIKFNQLVVPYGEKSGKMDSHYKKGDDGRWFRWQKRRGQEPYRVYLSEGVRLGDWWDIPIINASSRERLGYPTQKPEALLERIIQASSNVGELILDPFCGCGTTIAVAQRLKRNWIGIDITHLAVGLIKHRLQDSFGDDAKFKVIGEPVTLPDAKTLAAEDPHEFQHWALGLVGARSTEQKKGPDKGIDGRLYFHDDPKGKTKQIIFSVKAGHISPTHLRDLRGVIDREKAEIGVLICMEEPSKHMRAEAADAGFYEAVWGKRYPRLQILTVKELLDGKKVDYPPSRHVDITFKKAPKVYEEKKQEELQLRKVQGRKKDNRS